MSSLQEDEFIAGSVSLEVYLWNMPHFTNKQLAIIRERKIKGILWVLWPMYSFSGKGAKKRYKVTNWV